MGDSARAGTIQLPRAARAASAGRRSPRRVRRPLPPRQVWSSGSPRSVGGRAEVQPSRSHHSGRPRAPATGLWPRGFSASDAELGRRPGPCGRLSSASGPDPTDAQTSPAVAGESRGLACLSNAARGPTREPASPRWPVCPRPGRAPPSRCRCSPGPLHPCGPLTVGLNEALGRVLVARGKPQSRRAELLAALAGPRLKAWRPARVGVGNLVSGQTRGLHRAET